MYYRQTQRAQYSFDCTAFRDMRRSPGVWLLVLHLVLLEHGEMVDQSIAI